MGSENPSEVFYSADEDLSSLAGGASGSVIFSRNSSLQHSGPILQKQEPIGVPRFVPSFSYLLHTLVYKNC